MLMLFRECVEKCAAQVTISTDCGKLNMELIRTVRRPLPDLLLAFPIGTVAKVLMAELLAQLPMFEALNPEIGWPRVRLAEMKSWRPGQPWPDNLPEMDHASYQPPGATTFVLAVDCAWLAMHRSANEASFAKPASESLDWAIEAFVSMRWGTKHRKLWDESFTGRAPMKESTSWTFSRDCEAMRWRVERYLHLFDALKAAWSGEPG
jgi:hypothetical protein